MGEPPPYDDLATAHADAWARLVRATRDRRSPFHHPVVATLGLDGAPRARVMILRGADPVTARLRLHTDVRTAKVAELASEPRLSLLFYDPPAKLQLRVEGVGRVETDSPAAEAAWAATRLLGRRCYTAPLAPGTETKGPASGLPPELEGREPTREESEAGRPHFSALLVDVNAIEFLWLAMTGHRRGRFELSDGAPEGRWLIP